MTRYIIRRIVLLSLTLLIVTVPIFSIVRLAPGDPALMIAGSHATKEILTNIRHRWRLDEPVWKQYLVFMRNLARGDLGVSVIDRKPVFPEVVRRLFLSLMLAIPAFSASLAIGIILGMICAVSAGKIIDKVLTIVSVLGSSLPVFWIGLVLIQVFSVWLRLLPSMGRGSIAHTILPITNLFLQLFPLTLRQARSSILEVLGEDYVSVARAKGLPELIVNAKHVLKNGLIPVITTSGVQFGMCISGAIITEIVFAWPGLGRYLVISILSRDYPSVQGGILMVVLCVSVLNLLIDLLYQYLDPRIRY